MNLDILACKVPENATLKKQADIILDEGFEIKEIIRRFDYDITPSEVDKLPQSARIHLIEEVIDCITACATLLSAWGFDESEVARVCHFVKMKNELRGRFNNGKSVSGRQGDTIQLQRFINP